MAKRKAGKPAATPARRVLERIAMAAAVTLVAVVPLVWDSAVTSAFRAPKSTLALAAWAVLGAVFVTAGGRAAWRDPWFLPWLGAAAAGVASAPLSGQPLRVISNVAPLLISGLGWMAVRQLRDSSRRRLADTLIGVGVLEAALTLAFLYPSLRIGTLAELVAHGGREVWIGTLGNPGDVAMFLALPALLAAMRAIGGDRHKFWYGGAALLMAAVVVGSQSMSGVAALVAGAAVVIWRRLARRARIIGSAALLAATLLAVAATPLRGRATVALQQFTTGRWIWLGTGRAAGYGAAVGMLAAHPATGAGFDLFEANAYRFQSEDTLADRGRELGLFTGFGEAHNDLLQFAAETGLAGLALLVGGIWLAARRGRGEPAPDVPWRPLAAAAGVLVLLQFPLHIAAVAAQWAILAALAVPPPPEAPPLAGRGGTLRAVAAALLACAALLAAWQQHRANVAVEQGKLLATALRTAPDRRVAAELARRAVTGLDRRRPWLPYSWDLELTAGNLAMVAGDPGLALRRFDAALALADRPEIRFDVGMAMLAGGDRDGGLAQLERAARLNPSIVAQIADPGLRDAVLTRLGADGYLTRHPWVGARSGPR